MERDQIAHRGFLLLLLEVGDAQPRHRLTLIAEKGNTEREECCYVHSFTARQRRGNQINNAMMEKSKCYLYSTFNGALESKQTAGLKERAVKII